MQTFVNASGIAVVPLLFFSVASVRADGLPFRYSPDELAILNSHPERGVAIKDGRPCRQPIADACIIGADTKPTFAILGDSHAETLTGPLDDALKEISAAAFVYTIAACPFILNVTDRAGSYKCDAKTNAVMDAIRAHGIRRVIVNDRSTTYLLGATFNNGEGGIEPGDPSPVEPINFRGSEQERVEAVKTALRSTIKQLIMEGIQIYYLLPIPEVGWHAPRTIFKKIARRDAVPLTTSLERYLERNAALFEITGEFSTTSNFTAIYPHEVLCDASRCHTQRGTSILYTDTDHLSAPGAAIIVRHLMKYVAVARNPG